ncbi:helix-turn-helix domain-containing protein [Lentzea atacamensis]|uniref:helix-turn-helix domain-containing protein n=2 Tax=Lentzea TaxID=165301 RepID=UPI001F456F03|nr:helix-turn-helix domain-containing protein [Lentzea atacamensis]
MLRAWTRHRKQHRHRRCAARIVLRCAEGGSDSEIAAELEIQRATAAKWRSRFVPDRLDGLLGEPRAGGRARSPTTGSRQ